jgi:DNA topoisomerase-1
MIYDTVIISEKPIAGQSIAYILSGGKMTEKRDKGQVVFEFNHDKMGKTILIPLKGHITDVDFTKEHVSWYGNLNNMVTAKAIYYKTTEPQIVKSLNDVSTKRIIVATDADREGESIGREATNILLHKNPNVKIERAYFSAITNDELNNAFNDAKPLDEKMADAADSRREIDLYWGAVLTRFMSTNTGLVGKDFLSVGRVQSPTLAKIVEKEFEIDNFISTPYWEINITLEKEENEDPKKNKKEKVKFKAEYKKGRILKKEDAEKIFAKLKENAKVINVEKKETTIKRPEPFNTTDFLRAAANLNVDAMKAMSIAENLYMRGYVSYPRTDNQTYIGVNFEKILKDLKGSEFDDAIDKILKLGKIVPSKGVTTKDHPPVHPVSLPPRDKIHPEDWKVFKLITDHFLATLYKDAKANTTSVDFDANTEIFNSKGLSFIDKGWLEIYPYVAQKEAILPELKVGEVLPIVDKELLAKKTQPPARYSQGTLIKLMEKLNLGTKSTRPAILQKLYDRKYIDGKKQIKPSDMAKTVVKTLKDYADHVVSPDMTAKLEEEMNDIEKGEITKDNVVEDSRKMLLEILVELYKNKAEISTNIKATKLQANLVGVCPLCKSNLVKRNSRMGKIFVGCSAYPKCTQSYPLPQKGTIAFTDKACVICKAPIIQMTPMKSKEVIEFCINPNCESNKEAREKYLARKEEFEKNKLEKANAAAKKELIKKELKPKASGSLKPKGSKLSQDIKSSFEKDAILMQPKEKKLKAVKK